ncbi:MAG: NYN domain-containing protein [Anaerolineaceae bacterium]|nr:NYN domain-containing protein [Anaerolineaceae bacterium]
MRERQLALFINLEQINDWAVQNQVRQIVAPILCRLEKNGQVNIRKAYANWSSSRNNSLIKNLIENGVHPIQIFDISLDEQEDALQKEQCRGNIQMALDIFETILQHDQINTIALVTVDGEYRSLVSKIQEYGRMVIGIGPEESADPHLVKACDRYMYLDDIVANYSQTTSFERERDARFALEQAFSEHVMTDELPVDAHTFKQTLLKIQPNFNEKSLGYRNFTDYLDEHKDLLSINRTDENGILINLPTIPENISDEDTQTIRTIPIISPNELGSKQENETKNIEQLPVVQLPTNTNFSSEEIESISEEASLEPDPLEPQGNELQKFLQNPQISGLLQDIENVEIDLGLTVDQHTIQGFIQEGLRQTDNFDSAAENFLLACRLHLELITENTPEAELDDLVCMMASYAAYKAGGFSNIHNQYDKAEKYYLAFFALLREKPDLVQNLEKLTESVLKNYWLDIGRSLSIKFSKTTTPENVIAESALYADDTCRITWIKTTEKLAKTNPAILELIIKRLQKSDEPNKNRVIELIHKVMRSNDTGILDSLSSPFLNIVILDVFYLDKSKTLSLDRMTTIELAKAGDRERQDENFQAASKHFLEAAAVQWKLIEMRDEYSLQVDLNQYLALYSVVKAKDHFAASQYAEAEPYHLVYFTLVQENGPLWKKLGGLIVPTLMDFWITAAGKSKVAIRNVISPVKVAIEIATHPDGSCRENWRLSTRKLARANPSLLKLFSSHIRTSDTAPLGSKRVANQIEAIVEETPTK